MEAIIRGVISHHATEIVKASTANTPISGVATDASSHLAIKTLPALIQYFDWKGVVLRQNYWMFRVSLTENHKLLHSIIHEPKFALNKINS
jgi:hypothetical protein